MEFPEEYKLHWWIGLLILFLVVIVYRLITSGLKSILDILIVFIWIALLLMPLFDEIGIFGFKLKKEIDNLRTDLTSQMISLRTEVQNSIQIGTNQNVNIIQSPPPDEDLPEMEKSFDEYIKYSGLQKTIKHPDHKVSKEEVNEDIKFLFSTRYLIEKELRNIWVRSLDETNPRFSANRILRDLTENGIVDVKLSNAIKDILRVCNPAIHGQKVTDAQIDFVKDLGPKSIAVLKDIQNQY